MMSHYEITLSETEQKVAEYIAKKRFESARKMGIPNNRKGPQSDHETDLEGVASEMAAAKILNVWPDLEVDVIPDHDLLVKGKTLDIKATKYVTGHLIAGVHKKGKPCDWYMLMIGTFPTYRVGGLARREQLLSDNTLKNFGSGMLHAMKQEELISVDDFIGELIE